MKMTAQNDQSIPWFLSTVGPMLAASKAASEAISRRSAPHFTCFRFIQPDENGLSDIIAHFLDPASEHGQGAAFLKILLNHVGLRGVDLHGATVRREASAGVRGGFIDILIEASGWRVVIENKPWAGDQHEQLERYWRYITRGGFDASRCRVVYISPGGELPSSYSLGKRLRDQLSSETVQLFGLSLGPVDEKNLAAAPYPVLPFYEVIREWVSVARPSHVRQFLDELGEFLNNSFGEPEDTMQEQSEALAGMILQNRDMTHAALRTADAADYMRNSIRDRFFEAIEDFTLARLGDKAECSERISNTEGPYRKFRLWRRSASLPRLIHVMVELFRNGRVIVGIRAPSSKLSGFKKHFPKDEPLLEETRIRAFKAVEHLLPNAKSNIWYASQIYFTSEWPNLDTTEGMLFMYDALEDRDDSSGTIQNIVERLVALADALDQQFS